MKGLKVTTLLAAFVGLAIATPAMAQREPSGLSLELGGNYIMDSDVRDATGEWGWRIGLGYDLPTPSLLAPEKGGRPSVKLTYAQADDDVKLTVWGLTYEERVPFSPVVNPTGTNPYWGLGVGVFFGKAEFEVADTGTAPPIAGETISEDDTNFGGRLLVGVDFASKWYVEASYNLSGDVVDGDTNSIGIVAGARF